VSPTFSFWQRADRDAVALVDPAERPTTVGALQDASNQLVHSLRARGIGAGDTVAMLMTNRVEVYQLMLAIQQMGVYLVPINWHLAAPEVAFILEDSESKAVFFDAELAGLLPADAPLLRVCASPIDGHTEEPDGSTPFAALLQGSVEPPADRRAGMVMNYTSGTTGRPKGVRRPLPPGPPEPVVTGFAMFLLLFGMQPGHGVQLVGSPLYHTAVLYFSASALHLGHRLILMERWTPEGMLQRIERYRVTASHMVPTQFVRLLAAPDRASYDVSSVRHMVHSAAPCPVPIKQQMLDWWGDAIWEYYAATEGGGTVVSPQDWRQRPGTVGRPWQGADIRVIDDEGARCPPGVVGTVYIRMPQTFAYHRDQEKTAKAYNTEGYFTVGDAGWLDDEGWLYLSDRKADMIISGGVNIYPAEIEAALVTHPAVLDVAVFGVPDDTWGESVQAVIELREGFEGSDALAEELREHTRARIARFKCPRGIAWITTMPRDPNGKLAKRKLRDPYWVAAGRAI
jgi:long-chain acyl-CoA synthetase